MTAFPESILTKMTITQMTMQQLNALVLKNAKRRHVYRKKCLTFCNFSYLCTEIDIKCSQIDINGEDD